MPSIKGTDSDDTIWGNGLADRIYGRLGNDVVYGHANLAEQLWGGDGNDWLISQAGDVSKGAKGDDVLVSTVGNDLLVGGNGNDTLLGGGAHTEMFGQAGHDVIRAYQGRGFGGGGDDAMIAEEKHAPGYVEDGVATYLDGGKGLDRFYAILSAEEPGGKIVIEKMEAGESLYLRLDSLDGTVLLEQAQVYDVLDANDDGRFDVADGFDPNTGWGVTIGSGDTYQGAQLELHIAGDTVVIGGRDHFDFLLG